MTLPTTTILPTPKTSVKDSSTALYLVELVTELQEQYEEVAEGINGITRRSVDSGSSQWLPIMKDTADIAITFTYDHQEGIVLRRGLNVDVFFDIKWSAASGALTGNMYLELPYKVANYSEKPFVGSLMPSSVSFTGGTVVLSSAIPDTYRLEVWYAGDGVLSANQASVTSGQIAGHITYIGQAIERS